MEKLDDIPRGAKVVLPPHGFVSLQAYDASDLDVVNAARVSFAKQSDWEYFNPSTGEAVDGPVFEDEGEIGYFLSDERLNEADEKVLRYLLKGKHGTPFEHNFFKWHTRAPIFVFREWHRHRIGVSINEESARYSPLRGDFYVPEDANIRGQVGKPGHYTFEPITDGAKLETVKAVMESTYRNAYSAYESLLVQGVAKEVARAVLPVGIYSQMIWSCNARSLMNFINLRNSPHALHEIKVYAAAMEETFAEIMPITHQAFVENGRIAP